MSRFPYDAEARESFVRKLADQLLKDWIAKLEAGDKRAMSDLQNTVLDRLTAEDCAAVFVRAAVHQAGNELNALAARAMRDQCHADAERSANFIERRRLAERGEGKVHMAECDRAFV